MVSLRTSRMTPYIAVEIGWRNIVYKAIIWNRYVGTNKLLVSQQTTVEKTMCLWEPRTYTEDIRHLGYISKCYKKIG